MAQGDSLRLAERPVLINRISPARSGGAAPDSRPPLRCLAGARAPGHPARSGRGGTDMSHKLHAASLTAPLKSIRRFDVFAEVNRLKALDEGRPEDEAKGYGIWLAKVVAGRRYGQKTDREGHADGKGGAEKGPRRSQVEGFKAVGGEL